MISLRHNLQAMTANRQLNQVSGLQQKIGMKLSSGYQINRAADHAAGLAISEKMRKQIRGLNRGLKNTLEGIEICKIADGALNEVSDMLQRMSELSIQAANGTNNDSDRSNIQQEISQIEAEINRISESTVYNQSIHLLKEPTMEGIYTELNVNYSPTLSENQISVNYQGANPITINGTEYQNGDSIDFNYLEYYNQDTEEYSVVMKGAATIIKPVDHGNVTKEEDYRNQLEGFINAALKNQSNLGSVGINSLYYDVKGNVFFREAYQSEGADGTTNVQYSNVYLATTGKNGTGNLVTKANAVQTDVFYVHADVTENHVGENIGFAADGLWIQTGAKKDDGMMLQIDAMNAGILGVAGLNVETIGNALQAIGRTEDAIAALSVFRSKIGAQQNRLEHSYNNTANIIENTTAAESRIRDTDMAQMMVDYAKQNILAQAGQAMLAQAEDMNQNILNLLQ